MPPYTATYAFNGYLRGEHDEVVSLIDEAVAEMQGEGIDISFLGAVQQVDAAGQLVRVTARYDAPDKGTVGDLNCRARLPAVGSPRPEDEVASEPADDRVAVAGR
jgi:hypothetical protein